MTRRIIPLPAAAAQPLALMHRACFPDDSWDAEAFWRLLALRGAFGYVGWYEDAAAGFILARDLGEEAEILTFGVLPEMRRAGIARALLDAVIAEAGRGGVGSLVLEVAADNGAARLLYKSAGFARVGRRPRYYSRGQEAVDALILRLGLPRCSR
jgi:ribosomal-protein-alanine N-acetyltransferase